jgi:hypothetical protein
MKKPAEGDFDVFFVAWAKIDEGLARLGAWMRA